MGSAMGEHSSLVIHERAQMCSPASHQLECRARAKGTVANVVGKAQLASTPGSAVSMRCGACVLDGGSELRAREELCGLARVAWRLILTQPIHILTHDWAAVDMIEVVEAMLRIVNGVQPARAHNVLTNVSPGSVEVDGTCRRDRTVAPTPRCAVAPRPWAVRLGLFWELRGASTAARHVAVEAAGAVYDASRRIRQARRLEPALVVQIDPQRRHQRRHNEHGAR